jgi:pimeloyl-ACP methyl ester carboxylesterase
MYDSGASQRLYPSSDSTFVAGEGFSGASPVTLSVRFDTEGSAGARWVDWAPVSGNARRAERLPSAEETVRLTVDGVDLCARLDLPPGDGPFPGVVLVHGSGSDPATQYYYNGDFFVAAGFAALTFDKRGSGCSGGDFTFDYDRLARDVVAAVEYLAERPEVDPERIGLLGYSQGGWVAPLAASMSPDIAFVVVGYGMIESSAVEAELETVALAESRGVSGSELEEVRELTSAAVRIVASGFDDGWEEFHRLRDRYRERSWMDALDGTTVRKLTRYPRWVTRIIGPFMDLDGLDWYYDSGPVLDALDTPMLWILGGRDGSAPNQFTIPRLRAYADQGKPYRLVVFPEADHTMLLFEEVDGARRYTGYVPEYFRTEVEGALEMLRARDPSDPH